MHMQSNTLSLIHLACMAPKKEEDQINPPLRFWNEQKFLFLAEDYENT